jgi:hypothetical protein
MYDLKAFTDVDVTDSSATPLEKMEKWKTWASLETQRRTVLGLYIIDAQLARYSGGAPVGRHVTNPLTFSSPESIFNAKTADDWIIELNRRWVRPTIFREVFLSLFDSQDRHDISLKSNFSIHVVLEGLQALLSENRAADGSALGIPSKSELLRALLRFRRDYLEMSPTSPGSLELLLRWHAICLDLATDAVLLCRRLCAFHGCEQNLFFGRGSPLTMDLDEWARSVDARRTLLHAISIQDIAERLPIGRAHATHVPTSIFAAATVYCALSTVGQTNVASPESVDWDEVWYGDDNAIAMDPSITVTASLSSDSKLFVQGLPLGDAKAPSRNLRYSLLTLQMIIRNMSSQWGVSQEMLNIFQSWTSAASQASQEE